MSGETSNDSPDDSAALKQCPSPLRCFGDKFMRLETNDATAFQFFRMANGPVVLSNVFLATAFITVAERSLGCEVDSEEECTGKVYGIRPSSLIALMSTISGLLSAFFLPIIGAIVDCTKYRRQTFAVIAAGIMIIQTIHIGITESTWFPMALLQPFKKFFFDSISVPAVAYLIEIRRDVGEATSTRYSSRYYAQLFGSQLFFTLFVVGVSRTLIKGDDVSTARLGQCLNLVQSGSFYLLAVYFFTNKEPRRTLGKGQSLVLAGLKQVGKTSVSLCKHYPTTLTRFLLSVIFGQAAISSFTAISVSVLSVIGFNAAQTGLVFLVVLASAIPGSLFASWVTKKTNPTTSMKLVLASLILLNFVGFPIISNPNLKSATWGLSICWGFLIGWYYPTEALTFSSLTPKGQESELSGFFLYCGEIMSWLPPLIFTFINESESIALAWGGIQLNFFLGMCLLFYFTLPAWEECMEITGGENKMIASTTKEEEDEGVEEFNVNQH